MQGRARSDCKRFVPMATTGKREIVSVDGQRRVNECHGRRRRGNMNGTDDVMSQPDVHGR
ncbi:MAG: hypothetical protein GX364_03745 [Firmicutes bacterium]|nr:hypothetical protein [Bacillota bacterium]